MILAQSIHQAAPHQCIKMTRYNGDGVAFRHAPAGVGIVRSPRKQRSALGPLPQRSPRRATSAPTLAYSRLPRDHSQYLNPAHIATECVQAVSECRYRHAHCMHEH
jgi:hypothetical protein